MGDWEIYMGEDAINKEEGKRRYNTDPDLANPLHTGGLPNIESLNLGVRPKVASSSAMTFPISSTPGGVFLSPFGTLTTKATFEGGSPQFRRQQLQYIAKAFLRHFNDDFAAGDQKLFQIKLKRLVRDDESSMTPEAENYIRSALAFREQAMQSADLLVESFCSRPAANKQCIDFDYNSWVLEGRKATRIEFWPLLQDACANLRDAGCGFIPSENQGPVFRRPVQYVAASIIESCVTPEHTIETEAVHRLIDQIAAAVREQDKKMVIRIKTDEKVRSSAAACRWFATVGRWIRQISPIWEDMNMAKPQ